MNQAVYMHINFTEQGTPLGDALKFAKACGYDGVEVRRKDLWGGRSIGDYLDLLCQAMEGSGLDGLILGGPPIDCVSADVGARKRSLDEALGFYEAAVSRLPVVAINFLTGEVRAPGARIHDWGAHGSTVATDEEWARVIEGGKAMANWLESAGLDGGIESHMRFIHDTAPATRRLVEAIGSPRVGVTLDAGNILAMPDPPALSALLTELGPLTKIVHLKNFYRTFRDDIFMARLKDGDINHRELFAWFATAGKSPLLAIEAPGPGDRISWAEEDIGYVKRLLNGLQWNPEGDLPALPR